MRLFTFWRMLVLVFRLAIRQLRAEKYFSLAMIANMLFGLIGFLVVDGFNRSFLQEIGAKTKQIAGGDLVLTSRFPWTTRQMEIIDGQLSAHKRSEEVSLVSMVSVGSKVRLVDLRFVDKNYPLYPGLQLEGSGQIRPGSATNLTERKVWIHRELQPQLGVGIGGQLKIGEVGFQVTGIVSDDPTASVGSFAFAPRVYAPLSSAEASKLITTGSRVLFSFRFEVPSDSSLKTISENLKDKFSKEFPNQDIRVQTHFESSRETSRLYTYLNDYLALIALVSLFLAGLGFAYLIRAHLDASISEVAILSALGASRAVGFAVYLLQGLMLGVIACILGVFASGAIMPVLARVMEPITGTVLDLKIPLNSGVWAGFCCLAAGILLSIPQLVRLWSLNTAVLLIDSTHGAMARVKIGWAGIFPAVLFLWVVAILESKSVSNGSIFALTVVVAAGVLSAISFPLSMLGLRWSKSSVFGWRGSLALRLLSRSRLATSSTFVALAIGATLINIIPQLKAVISREIIRPDSHLPQLFMFDVQDEQVADVAAYFKDKNANIDALQPMVRARLEAINDEPIAERKMNLEGEREEQQRQALQSRTQNLSYRQQLSRSEEILSGSFVNDEFNGQGLPALSVEEGFAKRVGVKIGDLMSFDVLGVPVQGKITSLRRVRWTSFEPNFMILVQPGVLNDAPKTWVGSISKLSPDAIDKVMADIVSIHSNITIIDVKAAVARLLVLVDKIGGAVSVVSWLALLGGCGVLFAIAYSRSSSREYEIGILKVLGAVPRDALISVLLEYTFIASVAVGFGIILSFGLSWGIATYVFKASLGVGDLREVAGGFIILPLSVLLSWLATRRALRVKIINLLN
jgi:putative ABC transport system permease protein